MKNEKCSVRNKILIHDLNNLKWMEENTIWGVSWWHFSQLQVGG